MKAQPTIHLSLLRTVAVACLCQCAVASTSLAGIITQWTFETSVPLLNGSATISGIAAEVGTGTASGVHVSAATDWSNPVGNGTAESFSSNTWAIGDYFQFSSATTGFEDIQLGWAQTSSSTGPGEFKLAYQVNGGGFSDFQNYTVLPNQATAPGLGTWTSTTEIPGYNFAFDLSPITALDNAAFVDFRLIVRTNADSTPPGTIQAAGTSRIDTFTISGTASAVPEPATMILSGLGFAGIGIGGAFRRWLKKTSVKENQG